METDMGTCTESEDTDLYGGLDESLQGKGNNSCTESTQECIEIMSDGEIPSDPNTDETENVLDLIQDEMLLFDELLVAENRKRKENVEKEKCRLNSLIQTNADLKAENESLKEQVQQLTSENVSLKQNISLLYKESKSEIECRDMLIADKNAKIGALEAELEQVLSQLFRPGRSTYNQSSRNDPKYWKSDASSDVRYSEKHCKSSSSSDGGRPSEKRLRSDTSSDCRSSEAHSKSDVSSNGKLPSTSEKTQEVNHTNERETRISSKEQSQKSVDSENTTVTEKIASDENKENRKVSLHAVPRELAEALAKFETQQAVSLNSLRRAFSEYQERQGLMTNTLKGSVKNYFTEDPKPVTLVSLCKEKPSSTECGNTEDTASKSSSDCVVVDDNSEHHHAAEGRSEHHRSAEGKSEHHRAAESKSEHHRTSEGKSEHNRAAEGKSEHNRAAEGKSEHHRATEDKSEYQQRTRGSPLTQKNPEAESKKAKTVEPKKKSLLKSYDGVPLKTLYQRRLAERMSREKSDKEKEKAQSEEKPAESTAPKPRRLSVRRSRTPCRTPVKRRHHASRSDSYTRFKRAKAFKPIVHRTPDKLPEVLKNDALDLFRFQGQPVPFAIKRKLGLKSKNSQKNSGPPEADEQQ